MLISPYHLEVKASYTTYIYYEMEFKPDFFFPMVEGVKGSGGATFTFRKRKWQSLGATGYRDRANLQTRIGHLAAVAPTLRSDARDSNLPSLTHQLYTATFFFFFRVMRPRA